MKLNLRFAFTLAEILITLGVIGVVAAMTLPTVIKHYQQQATVSKIKKFYTTINQAIKQSEAENGSCSTWTSVGNNIDGPRNFYNTYLSKYIKSIGTSTEKVYLERNKILESRFFIKLADGSGFYLHNNNFISNRLAIISYYPNMNNLKSKDFEKYKFAFNLFNSNCNVEPFKLEWNGTREQLKNDSNYGCNKNSKTANYCTKLIEYDGWQIAKDYPW